MSNFSEISTKYEKYSIVQKSASEILFELLDIQPNDNVLDLGCGTGHLTKLIRGKTKGKVVGVDPSEGMIEKAINRFSDQDITFQTGSAETLNFLNEFDIIFCNSTFQWFINPLKALQACYNALKNKGKMAIQSPAKKDYCPNFLQAIEKVKQDKMTKVIFANFTSPWLFRNTADEYKKLFEDVRFKVEKSTIDKVVTSYSAEEVFKIFESGAAAGYLNQDYYTALLTQAYTESFRDIVKKSFENQADKTGQVKLTFNRIYLLAIKEIRKG